MTYEEAVNIVKTEVIPFIPKGHAGIKGDRLNILYNCIKTTRPNFLNYNIKRFNIKCHLIYCFINDIQPSKFITYFVINNFNRIIKDISLREYAKLYAHNKSSANDKYLKSIFYYGLDIKYPQLLTYSNDRISKILKRLIAKHDKCIICGKYFKYYDGIKFKRKTCSKECYDKRMSEKMLGNNNPSVKYGYPETARKKQSNTMKKLINEGKFTPCITNSWSDSKVTYNTITFRSTWELYFYVYNKFVLNINLSYESTRILYYNKNEKTYRNYIVDFTDLKNKILYEIKPSRLVDNDIVRDKEKQARIWCESNDYKYIFITEEWFKNHYEQNILNNIVLTDIDKKKVLRCLKNFK